MTKAIKNPSASFKTESGEDTKGRRSSSAVVDGFSVEWSGGIGLKTKNREVHSGSGPGGRGDEGEMTSIDPPSS